MIAGIPADVRPAVPQQAVACKAITSIEDLRALIERARDTGRLAIGVETTSPEPMRADVVGIALATQATEGFYVPMGHRYIGSPRQLKQDEVREALGPILADAKVTKVAHDLKYIDVALSRQGMSLKGPAFDVMIASYLLDPEAPNHLSIVAKRELDATLATFDQLTSKARGAKLGFDEVDVETATEYAGKNVEAVLRLADHFKPLIERQGLGDVMDKIEAPLARVLAEMERTGVFVDLPELERLRKSMDTEMAVLEKRAHEAAKREFNVNSPRQLETILFDELGLKPIKRT